MVLSLRDFLATPPWKFKVLPDSGICSIPNRTLFSNIQPTAQKELLVSLNLTL